MGFLSDFKAFALKGNVVDMAVGVIIGGAFGKIVSSIVADVIMPAIGVLVGGVNFADLKYTLKEAIPAQVNEAGETVKEAVEAVTINYGAFIQNVIDFLIVALAVFFMIKAIMKLSSLRKKEEEAAAPEPDPEPTAEEKLLTEIRDLLKKD